MSPSEGNLVPIAHASTAMNGYRGSRGLTRLVRLA
jgi:hypothetical protein